jgi:hypothetical protein
VPIEVRPLALLLVAAGQMCLDNLPPPPVASLLAVGWLGL